MMARGQQWCHFSIAGRRCSFGAGHRIEYHYCHGWRYGLDGKPLTDAEYARISRGGTR
jgi:hypothetical protein